MIAGGGLDGRLDDELAAVDAELGGGVEWQRELCTRRVSRLSRRTPESTGKVERGGDQFLVAGCVGVDVQARRDAEVELDPGGLPAGTVTCSG